MSNGTVTMTLEFYEKLKKQATLAPEVECFLAKLTLAWKHTDKPNTYTEFNTLHEVWVEARRLMEERVPE